MHEIVMTVKAGLEKANATVTGKHTKTADIRKLSATVFRGIKDKAKDNIFLVCGELLEQHNWKMGVIAFDFAYRIKKQYDSTTFALFESWLEKYVRGWGDCDDFCTHAFGELLIQKPTLFKEIARWTEREEFWMRRASAVVLISSIWHDHYENIDPFYISDKLISDEHDLVRKGYGWMLKVLSCKVPQLVQDYLVKNKNKMPRVAFRYAIEKMDKDKKQFLMGL